MFKHFAKIIITIFIIISINACDGDSSNTTTPTNSDIPVGFSKSVAEFRQYEVIELTTDDCYAVFDVFVAADQEYAYPQRISDFTYAIDLPQIYAPGHHILEVVLQNYCVTTGLPEDIYSTHMIGFDLYAAAEIQDPDTFLENKINGYVALIDEMLLIETNQNTIDVLNTQRGILIAELNSLPIQEIAVKILTANVWNNNDPTALLPAAGILDTNRAAWILGSSICFAGGWVTGNPVLIASGLAGLIYNYSKFIIEYDLASGNMYSNIELMFDIDGGADYELNTAIEAIPFGATVVSPPSVTFTNNHTHQFYINKLSAMADDDKSIISDVKLSLARVGSLLPSHIYGAINSMSTSDKLDSVTDFNGYTITSISDSRLTASIVGITDSLDIQINEVTPDEITPQDEISLSISLSDAQGNQLQIGGIYKQQALPPAVTITSIDTLYVAGDGNYLTAHAENGVGIALAPENIKWSSSINGYLGSGERLLVSEMSGGIHLITVTATDLGLNTTDFKTITVEPPTTCMDASGSYSLTLNYSNQWAQHCGGYDNNDYIVNKFGPLELTIVQNGCEITSVNGVSPTINGQPATIIVPKAELDFDGEPKNYYIPLGDVTYTFENTSIDLPSGGGGSGTMKIDIAPSLNLYYKWSDYAIGYTFEHNQWSNYTPYTDNVYAFYPDGNISWFPSCSGGTDVRSAQHPI